MDENVNVTQEEITEEVTTEDVSEETVDETPVEETEGEVVEEEKEEEKELQKVEVEFEYEDAVEKGLIINSLREIIDEYDVAKRIKPIIHEDGVLMPIIMNIPMQDPQMMFYNIDKETIHEIINKFSDIKLGDATDVHEEVNAI